MQERSLREKDRELRRLDADLRRCEEVIDALENRLMAEKETTSSSLSKILSIQDEHQRKLKQMQSLDADKADYQTVQQLMQKVDSDTVTRMEFDELAKDSRLTKNDLTHFKKHMEDKTSGFQSKQHKTNQEINLSI